MWRSEFASPSTTMSGWPLFFGLFHSLNSSRDSSSVPSGRVRTRRFFTGMSAHQLEPSVTYPRHVIIDDFRLALQRLVGLVTHVDHPNTIDASNPLRQRGVEDTGKWSVLQKPLPA